ncbi:MAG: ATP-dependent sacrificial sulfur transferase LarE [Candidatus Omnitrophota bacterium]
MRIKTALRKKMSKLVRVLKGLKSVVIAYSGGVDSAFLLQAACDALGRENVLAVTAVSETFPAQEARDARMFVIKKKIRFLEIRTRELANRSFAKNGVKRCYYCKKELFGRLESIRAETGFGAVADGTNYDDLLDMRYGRLAKKEFKVVSPLESARMSKSDIRALSKKMGLPTHDKPSFACLASRIPYGTAVTRKKLKTLDAAETALKNMGLRQVRVRHHGDMARIEVYEGEIRKVASDRYRRAITLCLRKLGFRYVTVDLAGYRTGSMNPAGGK